MPCPGFEPKTHGRQSHREHAEDDRARHLVQREPGDEEETDNGKPGLRLAEVAQRDERRRIGGDDAGVLKGDQREKEADARGNAELQAHGNGID